MANKEEVIFIGGQFERPATVQRGVLEKGMGQTSVIGEKEPVLLSQGSIGFPNRTETWAMRVIRDGEGKIVKGGKKGLVDVKDVDYKGELEFLDWGKPGGTLIVCRYLKGYDTLDLLYQRIILNADENIREDDEAAADAHYIRMLTGDNYYDHRTDPLFIQYLRIHDYNQDSKSKDPNKYFAMFREKIFEQVEERLDIVLDAKYESLDIVRKAADDNTGARLKSLFKIVRNIADVEDVAENELFSFLKRLADKKPEDFVAKVNVWKIEVGDIFNKATAYKKLDLTKDGFIAIEEKNKFEVIAEGIPAKGDDMIVWCIANYLDPKAYECFFRVKKVMDKIK